MQHCVQQSLLVLQELCAPQGIIAPHQVLLLFVLQEVIVPLVLPVLPLVQPVCALTVEQCVLMDHIALQQSLLVLLDFIVHKTLQFRMVVLVV